MNHSTQSEYISPSVVFLIENTENSESEATQDWYHLLYKMRIATQTDNPTMSGYFLYRMVLTFVKK